MWAVPGPTREIALERGVEFKYGSAEWLWWEVGAVLGRDEEGELVGVSCKKTLSGESEAG